MSTHAAASEISVRRPGPGRMGFFTDTTVCIGCKACEVACKQWNDLPADGSEFRRGGSYDHTASLGAATWRHVRFVELLAPSDIQRQEAAAALARGEGGHVPRIPASALADAGGGVAEEEIPDLVDLAQQGGDADAGEVDLAAAVADMDRWVFMSDVCKHCTNAGCMDACPTGALIRTEFETVVLQADVCNGCGYCVPSCPFGVVDRDPVDGRAAKCTLCYDRLQDGLEPACAKACPTDSIQFGPYDELVDVARRRVATLHDKGLDGAYLYGAGDREGEQLAGGLARSSCSRSRPSASACPRRPTPRSRRTSCPRRSRRWAPASSPPPAWRPRSSRPRAATAASPSRPSPACRSSPTSSARCGAGGAHERRRAPRRHDVARSEGGGARPRAGLACGEARRAARAAEGDRDMTPAVGTRGGPASWRRAADAPVAQHQRGWADARWSFLFKGDSRYARAEAPADGLVEAANARGRGGDVPPVVQGPMMKAPVWTWEVPLYFYFGGMAAGASFVGLACDLAGDERSARVARKVALAALVPSPPLLIMDLGRPERFYNMLRIFKPRSPMSAGAWCLTLFGNLAAARRASGTVDPRPYPALTVTPCSIWALAGSPCVMRRSPKCPILRVVRCPSDQ